MNLQSRFISCYPSKTLFQACDKFSRRKFGVMMKYKIIIFQPFFQGTLNDNYSLTNLFGNIARLNTYCLTTYFKYSQFLFIASLLKLEEFTQLCKHKRHCQDTIMNLTNKEHKSLDLRVLCFPRHKYEINNTFFNV